MASSNLSHRFEQYLGWVLEQKWAKLLQVVPENCIMNGVTYRKERIAELMGALDSMQRFTVTVEHSAVDSKRQTAAVRIVISMLSNVPSSEPATQNTPATITDMPFFQFDSSESIAGFEVLQDIGILTNQYTESGNPHTLHALVDTPAESGGQSELESIYREYIRSINTGNIGASLSQYCHELLSYNGEATTISIYQSKIDSAFEHMPDTQFAIDSLVVDAEQQRVAARLSISGTPIKPFLGLDVPSTNKTEGASGKITIREHVFYYFKDHKIHNVWSLLKPAHLPVMIP